MASPGINISMSFDSLGSIFDLANDLVSDILGDIPAKNARSRFLDETGHRPQLRVRIKCPECSASFIHLTAVEAGGVRRRFCRCCYEEFDLE